MVPDHELAEGSGGMRSATDVSVGQGLLPKFPSLTLYDDAVEHITHFVQQDLWEAFKAEDAYQAHTPLLNQALSIGDNMPLTLLSIRWAGC